MHAGGDDFDNVIVDWLIKEHLRPAVSLPGMLTATCCQESVMS